MNVGTGYLDLGAVRGDAVPGRPQARSPPGPDEVNRRRPGRARDPPRMRGSHTKL